MQRLERLEARLREAKSLNDDERRELIELLSAFKRQLAVLDSAHQEHRDSIVGFAGSAAHEATRRSRNPDLLKLALNGFSASVKELESEHPRLVETVNGICAMLSNLGI